MIQGFFEAIAGTINRRPRLIALLVIALFCTGIFGMTRLQMDSGWTTYMDQDSAKGIVYSKYAESFQSDSIILIIEGSNPLDPCILKYIDSLEGALRQQKGVQDTEGIVDILKASHGGTLPASRAEADQMVSELPQDVRTLAVPSNLLTLVQIELDQGLSENAEKSVLSNVESIVEISDPPPGVRVEISGTPAFTQQMRAGLEKNMGILIGGAMILMVVAMGILFAYVRYRFMPVLFVAIGLVTSLGLMGIAGIRLNMAVIGAFPVLIGLGIDYAIQFQARFDEEARKGSPGNAVFRTVTRTGPAVMYAMLATCMGFLAMFVSSVPMVRSFGLVSIIGIFTCYWISCIGMPTLGLLMGYRPLQPGTDLCYAVGTGACDSTGDTGRKSRAEGDGKGGSFSYGQFLTEISVKIAKNPVPVLLAAGCIALAGFQLDPLIPIQTNENSFVPAGMPAKISMDKVERIIGASSTADFYVQGQRVTDLDNILWMKEFQDFELSHHPELTASTSIVTYVLAYNGGIMPETQAGLDEVLGKIPADIKDQYLSGPMNGVIEFNTVNLQMDQEASLKNRMVDDITFLQPPSGTTIVPTGDFELYTTLILSLAESKELMTYLGFCLVLIFLVLVYRHLHAAAPIIPIVFIVGWNAAAMYILNIPYTPLTATLGSMAIGVAAEYTILVMERYGEEEERLHDHVAAIQESVHRIGTAITVSGLATFFGFSALCLATFPIISNFGITTLIAVAFSLIGAILVMPAVLSLLGGLSERLGKKGQGPERESPAS